jgi:hypothetical protein
VQSSGRNNVGRVGFGQELDYPPGPAVCGPRGRIGKESWKGERLELVSKMTMWNTNTLIVAHFAAGLVERSGTSP